jgi:hypothetical protein
VPRFAPNKVPAAVKRRYFELIRTGLSGSQAAGRVGVSLSCGSLWFIDAGSVSFVETAISARYLSQDDHRRSATTVAKPLDDARRTWTTLEYRPSPRPVTDGPGRLAHSYGSEGRGQLGEGYARDERGSGDQSRYVCRGQA